MQCSTLIVVNRMPDAHIPPCNTENTDEMERKKNVEVVEENWKK